MSVELLTDNPNPDTTPTAREMCLDGLAYAVGKSVEPAQAIEWVKEWFPDDEIALAGLKHRIRFNAPLVVA